MTRLRIRLATRITAAWLAIGLIVCAGDLDPVAPLLAQTPAGERITGTVIGPDDSPVAGANVFLFETLDGDLTDERGRFEIATTASGPVTLVVLADGFLERRIELDLPAAEPIALRLDREPYRLDPIVVEAGRLGTGADARVELNTLDVVSTPGTAADVYRAIRTHPGLQPADEGAGLFVRGGDVFETKVFLDGAVVLSPYRYESPTGGFFGAFDPFQIDGIRFSTGGFGARWGDALSGVAALSTLGRPDALGGGATLSLASASATAAVPLPASLGARATATRSNAELLFRVNGATSEFTDPPEGRDLSGSVTWTYTPDAELKLYGLEQRSRLGVVVEEPSFRGPFDADEKHDLLVASWTDRLVGIDAAATAATASATSETAVGAFRMRTDERLRQVRGTASFDAGAWFTLSLGGEIEERRSSFRGRVPLASHDDGPGAPTREIRSTVTGSRFAAFVEADAYATPDLRITAGLRTDRSTLTRRRSWDPRIAAAYRLGSHTTLIGAWGVYHQVPAPDHFDAPGPDDGSGRDGDADEGPGGAATPRPPPMRATHAVAGFQIGDPDADDADGDVLLRVEGYRKRYEDLAQRDRDGRTVLGGRGESRGVDVFFRMPETLGFTGRVAWSVVRATRTDPNTRDPARSPFDITHAVTLVVDRRFGASWRVGASLRHATGRPFTPVVDAALEPERDVWVPEYGEPFSERLPDFRRVDLALSRLVPFDDGRRMLVLFVAVSNLLDRHNAFDVAYAADYSERRFARSQFKRSIYLGASLDF